MYFANTDSFKKIEGYHHDVHKYVIDNMNYVKAQTHNRKDIVPIILENFIKIEEARAKLFDMLDQMVLEQQNLDTASEKSRS
jgi:hypothetical protein